jgi:hypothetical protein
MKRVLFSMVVFGLLLLAACGGDVKSVATTEASEALTTTASKVVVPSTTASTAATSALGTRDKPVLMGTEVRIGDWMVKVTSYQADGTTAVMEGNEFNRDPEPGNQYVLIGLDATYVGKTSATFWVDFMTTFLGSKGNTFVPTGVSPENPISDAGETFTGNVSIEVPSDQVAGGILIIDASMALTDDRAFLALE